MTTTMTVTMTMTQVGARRMPQVSTLFQFGRTDVGTNIVVAGIVGISSCCCADLLAKRLRRFCLWHERQGKRVGARFRRLPTSTDSVQREPLCTPDSQVIGPQKMHGGGAIFAPQERNWQAKSETQTCCRPLLYCTQQSIEGAATAAGLFRGGARASQN